MGTLAIKTDERVRNIHIDETAAQGGAVCVQKNKGYITGMKDPLESKGITSNPEAES